MKKIIKPTAPLPILAGIAVGALLFILGNAEDAPGICLIGLSAGFLLIMWGIYNTGAIKKGFLLPILLFCFGAGAVILSIVLLLDGEFEDLPGLAIIGVVIGILLIAGGAIKLKQAKTGK